MIYGYARVSTAAQYHATQLADLMAAGCAKVFQEKLTGANADRPQLQRMMAVLDPGDLMNITPIVRIARDPTGLMVLARDMKNAGAGLRSLAGPALATTSEFVEFILAVLGVEPKLHRKCILENTARGRNHAKAKGVNFGRKPKLTPYQQREAAAQVKAGEPQRNVTRSYNVDQSTIARMSPE